MAENKKGFVLYADLIHTVELMTNAEAGNLFKHILRYVNDLNPETNDITIRLVVEPIKQQLKRDLKKYEAKVTQCSEAGKRSASLRKVKRKQRSLTDVKLRATDSTVKDNVIVNVKDNDKDNIISIEDAYDFLKNKEPEKIELFEMQNKKDFPDYNIFTTNFNSIIIENDIMWEPKVLLARLYRLNINWDKTPKKENLIGVPKEIVTNR